MTVHVSHRSRRRRAAQGGFSLVEVLVALSIIALLVGVAGPRLFALFDRGKAQVARIQIEQIENALDLYRIDVGAYPDARQGLQALLSRPGGGAAAQGWSGPYLEGAAALTDPWANPYVYSRPGPDGRPFAVVSLGADGAPGGEGADADVATP
jgi:general secretion pathway protein G